MSGYRQRRHPATAWPIAALLAALVFCGLAGGRAVDPTANSLHAALTATQTPVHDGAHWATGRPPRGKATTLLATAGSGLVAPSRPAAFAVCAALLVVLALVVRPRRRRIGRMHAGRGPPPPGWQFG
jgi:predicted lysophospholipase L1 biosynthesis ABC-type transport system permease subunit